MPYGGLLAADLRPGETVPISGATGHFGSAAVAVALAMGHDAADGGRFSLTVARPTAPR